MFMYIDIIIVTIVNLFSTEKFKNYYNIGRYNIIPGLGMIKIMKTKCSFSIEIKAILVIIGNGILCFFIILFP